MKKIMDRVGFPRFIITVFLLVLIVLATILKLSLSTLISDMLVRFGMNAILVLAMVPAIQCGIGINFNLPLGIICGLIGALVSIEFKLAGFTGFFVAILVALPLAILTGFFYGLMLNRIKGDEMTVGNYMGFSVVSLMCIFWLILPFKSPELVWAYGGSGLRLTISLDSSIGHVLNNFLAFNIGNIKIPTGLLLFVGLCCLIIWLYNRSKSGLAMQVAGSNEKFALSNGINVNRYRVIELCYLRH